MKTCKRCGETRPLAEFYAQKRTKDRLHSWCIPCVNKSSKASHERALDSRHHKEREYRLQREYGISTADYEEMLDQQHGVCAICHRAPGAGQPLAVDHDHATGRVRQLLCGPCNR